MNKNKEKRTLLVATSNKGKLKEIREILDNFNVLGLNDLDFKIEIIEDGDTFYDNAFKKADTLMQKMNIPVLADDSGLEVDALNGRPGVYSARFAGEDATDEENTDKLLDEMKDVPEDKRTARFVCVMCLVTPDGNCYSSRGETEGIILHSPVGENGFGYDPVFLNKEFGKTLAELSLEEKNAISHRGKALEQMRNIIDKTL